MATKEKGRGVKDFGNNSTLITKREKRDKHFPKHTEAWLIFLPAFDSETLRATAPQSKGAQKGLFQGRNA